MAQTPIQIEYNQELQPLEKLLSRVRRAGDFYASGSMEIPMPKVEVEGVGVLSFPVPPAQIAALVRHATRAPYGRGEETILDENVRKVWQLPPAKVRVSGKSWESNFDTILSRAIAGLGCEAVAVSAEFYKLLVYDTGGFFLSHRDTEKSGGMFGTLVVGLPSAHDGGELIIRHAGREVTVDMSRAEFSEVNFAAFYADCEHEVRPITEGNRVCLVFNLILRKREGKSKTPELLAPDYDKETVEITELLEGHFSSPNAPAKLAWLLEHHYSPEGLSFAGLKSQDAARAKVLTAAAARAGCAVHLGIVHIEESGSAQETYYDYRPRRWRRHYSYEEENEEENDGGSSREDFEIIEVCDGRQHISEWRDAHDQMVDFGEIPLAPGELLPDGALDDEKPDEQRYMEASGNEGASFERSYHRAALVLWPRHRFAEVLLQAGVAAALPYFKDCIVAAQAGDASAAVRKEAVALGQRLISLWKGTPDYQEYQQPVAPDKRQTMLRLLHRLGDSAMVEQFVAEVVARDYNGSDNSVLIAAAALLGPGQTGELYSDLVRRHMGLQPGHCVQLLRELSAAKKIGGRPEWVEDLRQIAAAAVAGLDEVGRKREHEWRDWQILEQAPPLNSALVSDLLDLLGELGAPALRAAAAEKFAARPAIFDPVTILVPALAALRQWDPTAQQLWQHCAAFLLERSERPPEPPRDWRQGARLECKCEDCRELQKFTNDPLEQVHRFRVRQDRRSHLHNQIERHGLEMTHVTERKGSPQTLVCTKDRRGYQSRCDQYRKDIAALTALEEKASGVSEETLKRIASACSRAAEWSPE